MPRDPTHHESTAQVGVFSRRRLFLLLSVAIVIGAAYWQFHNVLSLENLAVREMELRQLQADYPIAVYIVAFAIYVLVTGLSLPGATGMTLLLGWYFGLLRAVVLVSFASTAGATLAFLLSRYLFRDVVQQKFGERLAGFNENLRREGAFYLFTLRLIPAVPFFVINAVMGLTPISVTTYWWVTQIGMFPGTCVYVFAGSQVPSLEQIGNRPILSPQLIAAFVLLGIFPLAMKKVMERFRRNEAES